MSFVKLVLEEPQSHEWVQFDIGRAVLVFGIATRGRSDHDQWIATYNVQYVPNNSNDTLDWVYFKDIVGENQVSISSISFYLFVGCYASHCRKLDYKFI